MVPTSASLSVSFVPSYKIMFIPSSVAIGYSQTTRVVVQLREALAASQGGTPTFLKLYFSTTVPGLTISPSSIEWTAQQAYTTGRSIVVTASQPITTNVADSIIVTVNTTDGGYDGFSPTFTVAAIQTPYS